jgi:hypothetical protein
VWIAEPMGAARVESLVSGLQGCTGIETLALFDCADLTSDHLGAILPSLPRLRGLRIFGLPITSLSFLAQEPMTRQLSQLWLFDCKQLPLTELRHVHALGGLTDLVVNDSFNEPMDALCRSLHTPPSVLMPQLRGFAYVELSTNIAPSADSSSPTL